MTLRVASRLQHLQQSFLRRFMAEAPPGALNLGLGQSGSPVPEVLRARLHEVADRADYGPNAGHLALRQAIASEQGVSPDEVVVTCGVQEALALVMLGLVEAGDEVLVPDPGFSVYRSLAEIAGACVRTYALREEDGFRPTWEGLSRSLSAQTRLVVLVSPGNPTGAVATPAAWERLLGELHSRDIAVLSDEIYLDLCGVATPHPSARAHHPEALIAGGLSKRDSLAGWRLGWLIAPTAVIPPLVALHQHLVTSASTLVQDVALAAFTPEARATRVALQERLVGQRARAVEVLTEAGAQVLAGEGAFYLLVRWPGALDDLALARFLLHEAGVITIPGRAFGEGARGLLRISYALPQPDLDRALAALANALPAYREAAERDA